jgi:hypothetical protein
VFEPVKANDVEMAVLEVVFGRRDEDRLSQGGWLLWTAAGDLAVHEQVPTRFDEPVLAVFQLGGEAESVLQGTGEVIVVESRAGQSAVRALYDASGAPGPAGLLSLRYISVVADRYDEHGFRVERAVGARCKVSGMRWEGDAVAMDVEPTSSLRWWRTGYAAEDQPAYVAADMVDVDDVLSFGAEPRRRWPGRRPL